MANKNSIRYVVKNAESIYKQLRWHGEVKCPHCGSVKIYECSQGYKCASCRKRFTNYTNTIMHGSKLDCAAWVLTLYLMLDSRGISSVEVARKVGVTQKTAWFMMMKWRQAMGQDTVELTGVVSMDEAYLGGSWSNRPLRCQQQLVDQFLPKKYRGANLSKQDYFKINSEIHTPIVGMNDGTNVVLQVLPKGFDKTDIQDVFNKHAAEVSMCVSDSSKLYNDWDIPFEHSNHSKRQYTTESGYSSNNVEGLFSHLKRALRHNQVHISKRYMQLYLDEMSFRWRHRLDSIRIKMNDSFSSIHKRHSLSSVQAIADKRPMSDLERAQEIFAASSWTVESVEINGITYHNPF